MRSFITVIGAGSWGTSLAQVLADGGHTVLLSCLGKEEADFINQYHRNPSYLKDYQLSELIFATTDVIGAIGQSDVVVIAVPSFAFLSVIEQIQSCYHQQKLVIATKGLSASSDFLFSAQVERILQTDAYAFLSGPSHAEEVIQRMSTWVTIASRQVSFAQEMGGLFQTSYFHCEYSSDIVGIQIAGALKNLVAFLCGVSDGLGGGCNQRAVIVTKGIQEIGKLMSKCGGNMETVYGISGLGDTIVTSLNPLMSRNRQAGKFLAEGRTKQEIVGELMHMVVESFYVIDALPFLLGENAEAEYPLLFQALEIGRGKGCNSSLKL